VCYHCGELGHRKVSCLKLAQPAVARAQGPPRAVHLAQAEHDQAHAFIAVSASALVAHDERTNTTGRADLTHMRNMPVGMGACTTGNNVDPAVMVAELAGRRHEFFHGDGGADLNMVTERLVSGLPASVQAQRRASDVVIRGIGGTQKARGEVKLTFTLSYSLDGLPFETATFDGVFVIVDDLPGELGGLLGKEFCTPGHAFFQRLYQFPASSLTFFSDKKLPPAWKAAYSAPRPSHPSDATAETAADAEAYLAATSDGMPAVVGARASAAAKASRDAQIGRLTELAAREKASLSEAALREQHESLEKRLATALDPYVPLKRPIAFLRSGVSSAPGVLLAETSHDGAEWEGEAQVHAWHLPMPDDAGTASCFAAEASRPTAQPSSPALSPVQGHGRMPPDIPTDDEILRMLRTNPGWAAFPAEAAPILLEYKQVFDRQAYAAADLTLPHFELTLKGPLPPQCHRGPPLKPAAFDDVMAILNGWVAAGQAEWCAPDTKAFGFMFGVKKPDGRWRPTCNSVAVNDATLRDSSQNSMGDMADNIVAGIQTHFGLDFSDAFLGVPCGPKARELLVFRVGPHTIRFLSCPFGPADMPQFFTKCVKEFIVSPALSGHMPSRFFPDAPRESDISEETSLHAWLDDLAGGGKGTDADADGTVSASAQKARAATLELLRRILRLSSAAKARISIKKTQLGAASASHVGICYDEHDYWPDASRLEGLTKMPFPTTVTQLQAGLATLGYYRWAVRPMDFLELYGPLSKLNTAHFTPLAFTEAHQRAWRALGRTIAEGARIRLPDTRKPVVVHVDAANHSGGGIIISQVDEATGANAPIRYVSWSWNKPQQPWSANQKEAAALYRAITVEVPKSCPWAETVLVYTDHMNYASLAGGSTSANPTVRRWFQELAVHPGLYAHIAGPLNPADAPSRQVARTEMGRMRIPLTANSFPFPTGSPMSAILEDFEPGERSGEEVHGPMVLLSGRAHLLERLAAGPAAQRIREAHARSAAAFAPASSLGGEPPTTGGGGGPQPELGAEPSERNALAELTSPTVPGHLATAPLLAELSALQETAPDSERVTWTHEDGCRVREVNGFMVTTRLGRVVVPRGPLRQRLLDLHHTASLHQGSKPMHAAMAQVVYWPELQADCERRVSQCPVCQLGTSRSSVPSVGTLHPSLSPGPLHTLYMDTMGPLAPSGGDKKKHVLGAIDAFSRLLYVEPTSRTTSATAIEFATRFIQRYCTPRVIRTDGGKQFDNAAFRAWCEQHGIELVIGVPGHHRGQALIERAFQDMLRTLRVNTLGKPEEWASDDRLVKVVALWNQTVHGVTGVSPFGALHGFEPGNPLARDMAAIAENASGMAAFHERLTAVQELVLFRNALGQLVNKARFDARNKQPPRYQPGEYVMVLEEQRDGKLGSQAKGPYVVVGEQSPEIYEVHRLLAPGTTFRRHVSRLVAFDMALTDEATEATRSLGGGSDQVVYGIVGAIHGHTLRADGGYDFRVSWAGSASGATQVSGFELAKLTVFEEYVSAAGLSKKAAAKKPA